MGHGCEEAPYSAGQNRSATGPPASWQWLWRAFAPAGDHEEFGDLRPECLAEALQHSHGRILKAPLEPAHVGPIDLSVDRKDFLGKPSTHS